VRFEIARTSVTCSTAQSAPLVSMTNAAVGSATRNAFQ
jgi:hypothetical protein